MKIIFSRKGFDAGVGKVPSAILPDGCLVPFPIPASADPTCYREVRIADQSIGKMVEQLTKGAIREDQPCHLDPDLDFGSLPRLPGWRPSLGQISAAQSHLANAGVGLGDLFLFFGWFRAVEQGADGWQYVRGEPGRHVIFGWLKVGQVVCLGKGEIPAPIEAFANHPHLHNRDHKSNTLYIAADSFGQGNTRVPGAGRFTHLQPELVLTDSRQDGRSVWRLPQWMAPTTSRKPLTYHAAPERWVIENDCCTLRTVAKGQEFILDCDDYPEAEAWAAELTAPKPPPITTTPPNADTLTPLPASGGRTKEDMEYEEEDTDDSSPEFEHDETDVGTSRTYRYIVTSDRGFAPNPDDELCTLVCCKPKIRLGARVGDWIFGFASAKRHGRLIYAMKVGAKHQLTDYHRLHAGRRDCIYRPTADGTFEWIENAYRDHATDLNHQKDTGGMFALVSAPGEWWYFGNNAPDVGELLADHPQRAKRLLDIGRGHRVKGLQANDTDILIARLHSHWPGGGRLGEPHNQSLPL